jgi:hypothetical protein
MRWHAAWTVWVGLGILMEAVGLAKGGPLTRTARTYLLGGAAGSALLGAFLGWLPYHWLLVSEGLGWGDLAAVAVGAVAGLAGWTHRIGKGDPMLEIIRMARSWAWPVLLDVGRTLLRYGPDAFRAARDEVRALEDVDLSGAEKRDRVVAHVREVTDFTALELPTWILHGIVQVALISVRGSDA